MQSGSRLRSLCVATLLLLCRAAAAQDPPSAPDYARAGPCAVDAKRTPIPITLPAGSGCGRDCSLALHLTRPAAAVAPEPITAAAAAALHGAPPAGSTEPAPQICTTPPTGFPLLFFYSGFQLRAAFYAGYAQRLASWGWVVIQYDLVLLDLVPAGVEVGLEGGVGVGVGMDNIPRKLPAARPL